MATSRPQPTAAELGGSASRIERALRTGVRDERISARSPDEQDSGKGGLPPFLLWCVPLTQSHSNPCHRWGRRLLAKGNTHDVRFHAHPVEGNRATVGRYVEVIDDWAGAQLRERTLLAAAQVDRPELLV